MSYEDSLKASLSAPLEAAAYLNAALEEGSQETFLLALKDVVEAKEISKSTSKTISDMESLHEVPDSREYLQLTTLNTLLHSLGLKLAVQTE